jgi:hypothetical protein
MFSSLHFETWYYWDINEKCLCYFLCVPAMFLYCHFEVFFYNMELHNSFSGGTLLVAQLVEALCHKSGRCGFDSRWCHWNFSFSDRTMALGLTQPPTEMSTRNIFWRLRRPVCRADNLTTFMCRLSWNLGISSSWNPLGLSRPVMGLPNRTYNSFCM